MAAPWRKTVAYFLTIATTRQWRCSFSMVAHGGRFWHLGVLTENGNSQKGKEKDDGSDTRCASAMAVMPHAVTTTK